MANSRREAAKKMLRLVRRKRESSHFFREWVLVTMQESNKIKQRIVAADRIYRAIEGNYRTQMLVQFQRIV